MRKVLGLFVFLVIFLTHEPSRLWAEWTPLSSGLEELSIRSLAVHPKNSAILFAGSDHRVYRSIDGGHSWKKVLSLRGDKNEIHSLLIDPSDPENIYVGSDQGVRVSLNGGKNWKTLFKTVNSQSQPVYCLAKDVGNSHHLWVGTAAGLFRFDLETGTFEKIAALSNQAVFSVWVGVPTKLDMVATTSEGVYKGSSVGKKWERVYVHPKPLTEEPTSLEQFDIEELASPSNFSRLMYLPTSDKFYVATKTGILQAPSSGAAWSLMDGQNLPEREIKDITISGNTFYVATSRGVFQWDHKTSSFRELAGGLGSQEIQTVEYSHAGDFLLAGTPKGVFKFSHPEINFVMGEKELASIQPGDILRRFENEPAILEIQNAAIRYAEVHPDKIQAWRQAASIKPWLPTLAVKGDMNRDQNVDIDRGGTNDPDKFIIGPQEEHRDWSAGVSWDLGELIWNDDQVSIDTRSRLMVELRDDVLNEVTHLYFERRRLQVELVLSPPKDLPLQVEKEIRLQELTADIDALTGGYLTKRLT